MIAGFEVGHQLSRGMFVLLRHVFAAFHSFQRSLGCDFLSIHMFCFSSLLTRVLLCNHLATSNSHFRKFFAILFSGSPCHIWDPHAFKKFLKFMEHVVPSLPTVPNITLSETILLQAWIPVRHLTIVSNLLPFSVP